ncbi:PAS domain S-box-containing protein [Aestuariispira insulae]|uniref:PAS domain S-box-containing protein n=1 Tax=Aestuariispira insulae TaxID=1461337 RepID=A0A3D9HPI1_9PROT|nr:PAS domain S-box-containing protein [Aestuariispira insulae]
MSGRERRFQPNQVIVSKTDLSGKLIYGNNLFYDLSGYDEKECIGQPHNIIRHPEMPRAVFDLLWKTLKSGEEIFAYVNNRSKNGDHYWVFAHVTPSRDQSGQVIGYHSNRRVPDQAVLENKIKPLYAQLLAAEKSAASPREGLEKSGAVLQALLKDTGMAFNQLMFSMGI